MERGKIMNKMGSVSQTVSKRSINSLIKQIQRRIDVANGEECG